MADCDVCGEALPPDSGKREPDDPMEIEIRYTPKGEAHPIQAILAVHRRHRTKNVSVTVPWPLDNRNISKDRTYEEGRAVIKEARTDLELVELANDLKAGRLERGWE
jgi:hypothetical protein